MNYLTFQKDDLIKVLGADKSGWWYGYVLTSFDQTDTTAEKGFFPCNYIKKLQSGDSEQLEREKIEEEKQRKMAETQRKLEKARMAQAQAKGSSYMDYVNSRFADKDQLTIHHRRQKMFNRERPILNEEEQHQQEVLGAYKRFGIGNANPTKAILNRTGSKMDNFKAKNVRLF